MKTICTFLLSTLLAIPLIGKPDCDRLEHYDMANLQESFEKDLTAHSWNSSFLGKRTTVYFEENGIALAIPQDESRAESFTWQMQMRNGNAVLQLFSYDGEQDFVLVPTCSGLIATTKGKIFTMSPGKAPHATSEEITFMEMQITGTWEYVSGNESRFSISFREDGTFTMSVGPDMAHSVHEGVWQLSHDGEHLILFSRVYMNGGLRYIPESMMIRSLDFEDMVLDGNHLPRILRDNAGKRLLFLSKVLT